ncbi:AAA family ATPase [Streptomyces sp. S1A1-7]|uniref:AAA family ATPase n=1 Tax=Streptomyces sp. S1A1-7 TaxID=2594459 RepID=UPI001165698A|nr:helix-turn-helix transcriptional regulator [Streptomyces sp. S1A1-7]QDN84306.1 AAA family ATPase [Streptomyces sp. S1A1-7]
MLVGREHELKVVEEFVLRAASDGDALVLYGEAGVGKTVLLDAAEEAAAESGVPVMRTVGVEVETDLAYAALYRLLTPFLSQLDGLSGQQRRTLATALGLDEGPPPDRLAVSNAVLSLLGLARGDGPLLVIVDDLPWLDRMSAAVLAFVARRLAGARIGFLGAFRTGESSFFDGGGLAALEVMPLGQTAAGSLIDRRFPALAPRVRQQVLAEAAGNPLALLELPARVTDRSHERQPAPALPLSQRLEHLFAARVDPLPAATRRALLLAALDATGDLGILVAAFGSNAIDDLAPAERAQLIRVNGERRRLAFRHPLMRSAVIAMSTDQQRRDLHAAIAAQMPDQPDRRAWHLAEAAAAPDESIAVLLEQTADRILRRGDAVGALSALLRAADLTPVGRDRGRRLARAAYIGAEVTGDIGSVPRLLADAHHADPGGADALAAAVATSAYLLNGEGDVNAAHRMLFGAIAAREVLDGEDDGLIEALWFLIAICVFGGRAELWQPLDGLMGRFRPAPPRYLTVLAKAFGDPAHQALPVLDELDGLIGGLSQEPDPAYVARVAIAGAYVDRQRACRGPAQAVVDHGREGGAVTSQIQIEVILANDDFFAGQWDEALGLCDEGKRLCELHGYPLLRWLYVHQDAVIAAARGRTERARAAAEAMTRWAAPRGVGLLRAYGHGIEALLSLGRGKYQEAFVHASSITPPGKLQSYAPYALWTALDLVEAAVRAGLRTEAARHVAALRDADIPAISPRLALVTAGAAGMVSPDGRFADHFEAALTVAGAERWPFDRARIQLSYGQRLRHGRAMAEARRHLGEAFDTFQRLDATPWSALAGKELRAAGGSRGKLQAGGIAALTPQQREIAKLAAAGLTNKQIAERLFLSPRTVSTHLYQIYPKLGVTTRAGLRDALSNEEQPTTE